MPETIGATPEPATPAVPSAPDLTELIALSAQDPERYGAPRRRMSAARKISLGVVGVAILGGVVGYIGWEQSNPPIQGTVISYAPTAGGDGVSVTFEVDKSAGSAADCVLDVEDVKGNVIGTATVQVPAGRAKSVQVYTVETTGSVNTAEVESCQIVS
jgi:hypothetical protein